MWMVKIVLLMSLFVPQAFAQIGLEEEDEEEFVVFQKIFSASKMA